MYEYLYFILIKIKMIKVSQKLFSIQVFWFIYKL